MNKFSRTLIHSVPTSSEEELQFAITQYEDRYYVDVRLWFRAPESKGLRPSRKGLSLPMHRLSGLREGIEIVSEAMAKNGFPQKQSRERKPGTEKGSPNGRGHAD